jgi:hypothetical protein
LARSTFSSTVWRTEDFTSSLASPINRRSRRLDGIISASAAPRPTAIAPLIIGFS